MLCFSQQQNLIKACAFSVWKLSNLRHNIIVHSIYLQHLLKRKNDKECSE